MTSPSIKLSPSQQRINLVEYRRQHWLATPEAGTTKENILDPAYWAHVSGRMKPMDLIDVLIEDGSAFYQLMVTSANRIEARVLVLFEKNLTEQEQKEFHEPAGTLASLYEAKWQGPSEKWIVLRVKDKHKVRTGFGSKEEAESHIKDLGLAA